MIQALHLAARASLFLLLLVIGSCESSPPPFDFAHPDSERALWSRVSEERAAQRVRQLATLGPRMGGTDSGDRAVRYLLRQFSAHGLEAWVVEDPPLWVHEEHAWSVSASTPGGERLLLERAWPYGFSPSSTGSAPLTLDTAGADDKALLLERLQRRSTPEAALVLIDGVVTENGEYPRLHHLSQPGQEQHAVFGISTAEGAWLREHLAEGVTLEWSLDATVAEASPETVVACIPAAESADEGYFLFCAHGDSDAGGPGANDNGSGEAIVLEIASAWATALRAKQVALPPRELRFAIWGSEIHSTRSYLERALEAGETILGVLNYDQSGFGSTDDVLYVEPDDLPANESLTRAVLAVLAQYATEDAFPKRWATNGSQGGTDSYVFSSSKTFQSEQLPSLTLYASAWDRPGKLNRTAGMPGESWNDEKLVHIDYDVYYHSAGDTAANTTDLEPFNMGWNARVGMLAVLRWLVALDG